MNHDDFITLVTGFCLRVKNPSVVISEVAKVILDDKYIVQTQNLSGDMRHAVISIQDVLRSGVTGVEEMERCRKVITDTYAEDTVGVDGSVLLLADMAGAWVDAVRDMDCSCLSQYVIQAVEYIDFYESVNFDSIDSYDSMKRIFAILANA